MNRLIPWYLLLVLFQILSACAPATVNQFLADGKTPLSEQQLQQLINGRSLHLEAIDFDAQVHFQPNGRLTAKSLQGVNDKGKWSITSDNLLCMKFNRWYFGDLKCYQLFKDDNNYVFFTTNGARYYTGESSGDSTDTVVSQSQPQSRPAFSKSRSPAPAPPLTDEDRQRSLTNLARNCPDCNFSGADLRGAQLVGANLSGANLSDADLRNANLRRANLAGANLAGANLTRTNLAGADLSDCDLTDADLTGSNLIRATVTGANLEGTVLSGAHLESIQGLKK